MDEHAKLERLLRIMLLLSGVRKYSIEELASKTEMASRTISRYIATIRKVGFIVECENGVYHFPRLEKPFKPLSELLHFSEEEAYILEKAIHSIDDTNLLKTNLVKKLYSLYDSDRIVETIAKPGLGEIVQKLIEGIKLEKQVLLRQYRSSHGNIIRDRLVEPFDFTTNYQYVWAFDPESRTNRLYKTARISHVELMDKPFQQKELHRKTPMDVFRMSSDQVTEVAIRLNTRAYNLLLEEYPLSEKYITSYDDNFWHFEAAVCGFEGVGRFCMGLPGEAEVLKPKELKQYLREQAAFFTKY